VKTCGYCKRVVEGHVRLCDCGYQFASDPRADIIVQRSGPKHLGRTCLILVGISYFGWAGYSNLQQAPVETVLIDTPTRRSSEAERPAAAKQIEIVQATDLYDAYDANEVQADLKYKGQMLYVQGIVEKIGKDLADTPYVELKGPNAFFGVKCVFSRSDENRLATVRKGQNLTIKGTCNGKRMDVLLEGSDIT
jgi:hypothetical protein